MYYSYNLTMPVVLLFHRALVSTDYTMLIYIGVWVKPKLIIILYPDANLHNIESLRQTLLNIGFELPLDTWKTQWSSW